MKHAITALAYSKKGRLLSVGKNSYVKTHPIQAKFAQKLGQPQKIFLHAEIDALVKAKQKVHRLVVIRIRKDGSYGLAKPCPVCSNALDFFGVKLVVYS